MLSNQNGNSTPACGGETPSRRGLLRSAMAGSLAAAAIGATGTASAAPGADAALIAACNRFIAIERLCLMHYPDSRSAFSIVDDGEREAVLAPIREEEERLVEEIARARATTMQGIFARASAYAVFSPEMAAHCQEGYFDERLLGALVRDLLPMMGAAS